MKIMVDFHTHTDRSPDGLCPAEKLARAAKRRGLGAIAVCDHNLIYRGESEIDGVIILPGCELSTDRGHLTAIFFSGTDGIDLSDIEKTKINAGSRSKNVYKFDQALEFLKSRGGYCVLAHPFQNAETACKLADIQTQLLDAVEIFNARTRRIANESAMKYAADNRLFGLSVSDAHAAGELGGAYIILEADEFSAAGIEGAIRQNMCTYAVRQSRQIWRGITQMKKAAYEKKYARFVFRAVYLCFYAVCDIFDIIRKK